MSQDLPNECDRILPGTFLHLLEGMGLCLLQSPKAIEAERTFVMHTSVLQELGLLLNKYGTEGPSMQ